MSYPRFLGDLLLYTITKIQNEPNQALEPTRMLVTDPAAQAPRQAPVRLI
jgi:hypothetical protein